jgi:DNA-binding MarR family transcriptional regulator
MSRRARLGGDTGPWIGSLLRHGWQRARERIYCGVITSGHRDLTRAHVGLFRFESMEGLRPSQLADQMSITKQSVNDLLRDLERLGYIVLRPDPDDKRARLVRLTARGRHLDAIVREQARAAEAELAETLGASRFNALRQCLLDLLRDGHASEKSVPAPLRPPPPSPKRRRNRAAAVQRHTGSQTRR